MKTSFEDVLKKLAYFTLHRKHVCCRVIWLVYFGFFRYDFATYFFPIANQQTHQVAVKLMRPPLTVTYFYIIFDLNLLGTRRFSINNFRFFPSDHSNKKPGSF